MKIPADKTLSKKVTFIVGITATIIAILYTSYLSGKSLLASTEDNKSVFITKVEESTLVSEIPVYGTLKPIKVTSVIALVKGTVTEIHVRPGDQLNKGDAIISMANPRMVRKYEEMKLSLLEQQTEHQKLLIGLDQEEALLKSQLHMAGLDHQLAQAEEEAQQELFKLNIVSKIKFKKIKLQTAKEKGRLSLAKSKLGAFYTTEENQIATSNFRVEQVKQKLALALFDKNSLIIVANIAGILNDLNEDIQLGSQITEGNAIGQITDPSKLYGELEISSAYIADVALGQGVKINVKGKDMRAVVKRIAPNVVQNKVKVDITLIAPLVNTARPNIDVTGTIVLKETLLSLISDRPQKIRQKNESYQLYVKENNQHKFELKQVKVGDFNDKKMQILHGAKLGDSILITVPEALQGQQVISMEQLND